MRADVYLTSHGFYESRSRAQAAIKGGFISLCKVLTSVLSIPKVGGQLITLVKPQFEVGKAGIGKGGIVKSESDALMALSDVSAWITHQGWHVVGTIDSPIKGGSGNSEYLLYAVKQ